MKTIRKITALTLIAAALCCLLAGCGSSASYSKADSAFTSASNSYDGGYYGGYEEAEEAPAYDESYDYGEGDATASSVSSAEALVGSNAAADFAEKLIYTANAEIETLEFDQSVQDIQNLLIRYNAFLESSYVSGNTYDSEFYGYAGTRYARFTIRVPKENYSALTGALDTLGNVTGMNTSVENITQQYNDVDSRLQTYRTEESRLLSMLEKAETVEDMLSIESRLSEVRYNIESLTTTLRGWDNEVNYSTVTVNLNEVEKLTRQVEVKRSYGEKMLDGLKESLSGIGEFFSDLLLWLVAALPVLILLAIVVVVITIIIRACFKRVKAKRKPRFNPETGTPIDQEKKE